MKTGSLTRREFLKFCAGGAGMLATTVVLPAPTQVASAQPAPPTTPLHSAGQISQITPHTFSTAVSAASGTSFAPTDVSMGWDGTVWALDAYGTPYLYDASREQADNIAWVEYGEGIDSVVPLVAPTPQAVGIWQYTKGGDAVQLAGSAPDQINTGIPFLLADKIQTLNQPESFANGLDGALSFTNPTGVYLFANGQYTVVNGDQTQASAPQNITSIRNWNTLDTFWQDGVIDLAASGGGDLSYFGMLIKLDGKGGGRCIRLNWDSQAQNAFVLTLGTADFDIAHFFGSSIVKLLGAGLVDAMIFPSDNADASSAVWLFCGPWLMKFNHATDPSPAVVQPMSDIFRQSNGNATNTQLWPIQWQPNLIQAPSGRIGNLWSVAKSSDSEKVVVQHDGAAWNLRSPLPNGISPTSVACDLANNVYCLNFSNQLLLYSPADGSWNVLTTAPSALAEVAASDPNHIFVRTQVGAILRYQSPDAANPLAPNGQLVPINTVGGPWTSLSANADGSLWLCTGDQNLYRVVPDSAVSEPIALPAGVTAVQRAGSALYGQVWALTTQNGVPQLFDYQSEHVFRSASGYEVPAWATLTPGFGKLYFPTTDGMLRAVDLHNGNPIAAALGYSELSFVSTPVIDHLNRQLYVSASPAYGVLDSGYVYALSPDTLSELWQFNVGGIVNSPPLLANGMLYVSNGSGAVKAISVAQAQAQAHANQPITAVWTVYTGTSTNFTEVVMLTPQIVGDQLYLTTFVPNTDLFGVGTLYVHKCNVSDGGSMQLVKQLSTNGAWDKTKIVPDGTLIGRDPSGNPILFIHGYDNLYAVNLATGQPDVIFPEGNTIGAYFSSLMSFNSANDMLYVGDTAGVLYQWQFYNQLPSVSLGGGPIVGRIAPILDSQGNVSSLCLAQNPDTGSGAAIVEYSLATKMPVATIPLAGAVLTATSSGLLDGMFYTASTFRAQGALGSMFGARVADVSPWRNVIAECELMQDYDDEPDPNTPGNTLATPYCRYQAHLTFTDDNNAPLPNQPFMMWADEPVTVRINNQSYAIGPTAPATIETGMDGNLTVFGGFVTKDGSDDTDLSHPALRLWSPFMDPFERVIVYPDDAFHTRLFNSTLSDPNDDDPGSINLATATPYGSTQSLFTASEVSNGTSAAAASAIQQLGKGITQSLPIGTIDFNKYIALGDLQGVNYFSVDVPATRSLGRRQSLGLQVSTSTNLTTYTDVGSATSAINALQSMADTASVKRLNAFGTQGRLAVRSFFHDLWDKIKKGVATVTHVIISVGNRVLSALRYVENQLAQVVQVISQDIRDIASHVGAFFVTLGKDIKAVVQVLGVLFNFGEILKTHALLKTQFQNLVSAASSNIKNNVIPSMQSFFNTTQADVSDLVCKVKNDLDAGSCTNPAARRARSQPQGAQDTTPISGLNGMGATAHSLFTVAPNDRSKPQKSYTVACAWGAHKLRDNAAQATFKPSSQAMHPASADATTDNPFAGFVNGFADTLKNDSALSQAFEQTKIDIQKTFKVNSLSQFASMAVADVLDLASDLLIGVMAVIEAFMTGVLDAADDMIAFFFDPNSGLLTRKINIPVLSSLYKVLTGDDLSILDVFIFVAAIPVTVLYRVIEGDYPSQDTQGGAAFAIQRALLSTNAKVMTIMSVIWNFLLTVVAPFTDAGNTFGGLTGGLATVIGVITAVPFLLLSLVQTPSFVIDDPKYTDWILWGLSLGGVVAGMVPSIGNWLVTEIGLGQLFATVGIAVDKGTHQDWLAFSINIASALTDIDKFLLAISNPQDLVLPGFLCIVMDGYLYFAMAIGTMGDLIQNWRSVRPIRLIHRHFLPWVSFQPPLRPQP